MKHLLTFIILHGGHSDITDHVRARRLNILRKHQYQCLLVILRRMHWERKLATKASEGTFTLTQYVK